MRTIAIAVLLIACGGGGARLSVDLRTDYLPGIEFDRVEVDIGGESNEAVADRSQDYLRGVRVADLRVAKGLQEGTVRLFTPRGVLLAERRVSVSVTSRFGITITVDRNCEDVLCPNGTDLRAVSCLGGRCVDPTCITGEEETCPDPQCADDDECPADGCGMGRCEAGTCLLEGGDCGPGQYCAGVACRVLPTDDLDAGGVDGGVDAGDMGMDAGADSGPDSGLCGMSCELPGQPCARAELDCSSGMPVCTAVSARDSSVVCRPALNECDLPDRCDGVGFECPLDERAPFGTPCPTGVCDGLGRCMLCTEGEPCSTGNPCQLGEQRCSDLSCQPAGPASADTLCRAAAGPCDVPETCGGDTACPIDAFVAADTECRASTGPCDAAESCTGSRADCPADEDAPDGTTCGSDPTGCAAAGTCRSGVCEPTLACGVSLAFDGVDDLASLFFSPASRLTFEAVARPSVGGTLLSVTGTEAWSLSMDRAASGYAFTLRVTDSDGCIVLPLTDGVPTGEWMHVAIWLDVVEGQAALFVDGDFIGMAPGPGALPDGDLFLGNDLACVAIGARAFDGRIANVRVWERLVSEAEIAELARGEDPSSTLGLTQWYPIDENVGQRLFDSVSGMTGTLGRNATPESMDPRWDPGG